VEALAFRSTEPPLHIHHREDEAWFILNGKMTFYVGDQSLEATAGCFVFGRVASRIPSASMSNRLGCSSSPHLLASSISPSSWERRQRPTTGHLT